MNFYQFRDAIGSAVNKGWVRFPQGQTMPEMPTLKKKTKVVISYEMICVQCGHEFFDSVKTCPKCLSPHVRKANPKPKTT